ncbi:hypothetical protein BBK82_14090 [Lentzea guizhouensis]|uniref:Uncharacterized protein n=1 Tax=Lentzea guizhouensis TaxID=1586287 RepID=A0A1B2HH31_9PSEU|nr:hypothetical protein [Lentzea guizhouensis]ANZ37031.1 hypothetical protein BBK82_14090 [Lentzea guizhouensis]
MTIEDELRGALDGPAPPPVTTLDDVLRRGRRRVAVRRAGLAGGVLAVVAAVGIGGVAWTGAAEPELPLVASPADWPQVSCGEAGPQPEVARRMDNFLPSTTQMQAWRHSAQDVLPNRVAGLELVGEATNLAGVHRGDRTAFRIDVRDGEGVGSLRFALARFEGDPAAAADSARWATGTCAATRRFTSADGTVFQLYAPAVEAPSQELRVQALYVFRADRLAFRVEQVNAGRTSARPTRETVPLSEVELVKLGAAVAEVS